MCAEGCQGVFPKSLIIIIEIQLTPMGVLTPVSAHAGPSAQRLVCMCLCALNLMWSQWALPTVTTLN